MIARHPLSFFITAFAAFALLLPLASGAGSASARQAPQHPACNFDQAPCVRTLTKDGLVATLGISPAPVQIMKRLTFTLELRDGSGPVTDGEVTLHLSMPGMYMPENVARLKHLGGGTYTGNGVLVRCASGSRLWQAEVRLTRPADATHPPLRIPYPIRLN